MLPIIEKLRGGTQLGIHLLRTRTKAAATSFIIADTNQGGSFRNLL